MATYLTNAVCGPVIGSMVSNDKGDFSNRTKCAGSQLVNNVKTTVQIGAVGLGACGAAKFIAKSPARISKVSGLFDKLVSKLPSGKFADKLMKAPGRVKAATLIMLPAIALVNYIFGKHIYKMGQIDQKYTDKAKLEEAANKNILG